jgi:hypothetical protein
LLLTPSAAVEAAAGADASVLSAGGAFTSACAREDSSTFFSVNSAVVLGVDAGVDPAVSIPFASSEFAASGSEEPTNPPLMALTGFTPVENVFPWSTSSSESELVTDGESSSIFDSRRRARVVRD